MSDLMNVTFLPNDARGAIPEWFVRGEGEDKSFSYLGSASPVGPNWRFIAPDPALCILSRVSPASLGLPPDTGNFFALPCKLVKSRKDGKTLIYCNECDTEDLLVVRMYVPGDNSETADESRHKAVKALLGAFTPNCRHEARMGSAVINGTRVPYGVDIFVLVDEWRPGKAEYCAAKVQERLRERLQSPITGTSMDALEEELPTPKAPPPTRSRSEMREHLRRIHTGLSSDERASIPGFHRKPLQMVWGRIKENPRVSAAIAVGVFVLLLLI